MTPVGARSILAVSALIALGGVWYYMKKGQLEVELAAARAVNKRVTARVAPSPAPPVSTSSAPTAGKQAAPARPTRAQTQAQTRAEQSAEDAMTARRNDVVELVRSGTLGGIRWAPPPKNDPVAMVATVAQVLALSTDETAQLRDAIETSRREIYEGILATATVTPQPDGSFTISVPDSPEARIAAQRLQNRIEATLGPERYAVFEGLGAKATLNGLFDDVGLKPTTFTVSHGASQFPAGSAAAARGPTGPVYSIRRQTPSATGSSGMSGPSRDLVDNNLGPLASLLPADF